MKNFSIDFFCKNCKKNVKITRKNLLPGRKFGKRNKEFLIFIGRCPKCFDISQIDSSLIPDEIKLELLDEYAGISSTTFGKWIAERELKKAKEKLQNAEEFLQISINIQKEREEEPEYQKRLFPNWQPNNTLMGNFENEIKKTNN